MGPEPWLYVGDYPADPFTTFSSPPFENGYAWAGAPYERVRFRHDANYRLELDGHLDADGGTDGTAAFTMPDEYVKGYVRSWVVDVITGATPALAQVLIPEDSGEVIVTLL